MGSKEYLQNQLDELLKVDTPEAMETYRSRKRKFPMQYSDCWLGSSGDIGFDMEIIDKRIAELRRSSKVRRGWLQWSGAFGGPVEFRDDPEGPFELSMLLNDHEHSQMVLEQVPDSLTGDWRNQYRPKNPYKFTASADPFEYRTSGEAKKADTRSRQSDGGIAVLWEKDDKIDGSENRRDWESERFVMSYRHSPSSLDAYCEDVLKTCIYFGAMLYLERNKTRVWEYFVDKGFSGYLMYEINRATGRPIGDKPGFATYAKVKNDLFSVTKDYIRFRGHKEQHLSYLMECKNINGMEQMNKYDRFVAHAGCLLGSKQTLYHIQREAAHSPNENALSEVIDFFNRLK